MDFGSLMVVAGAAGVSFWAVRQSRRKRRKRYIDEYRFHPAIREKLKEHHPQLTDPQLDSVFQGLRDYFHICRLAGNRLVSMPSQVVDDAWHEFILFTRAYQAFCEQALGRFLHHTPAQAMGSKLAAHQGIKRAWRLACHLESISPKTPHRLPLIFGLDDALNIPNGFRYDLRCGKAQNSLGNGSTSGYCATDIGCASGCSSGCSGGGCSSGGCSSGDSGGSDSGCSGGCGGGD